MVGRVQSYRSQPTTSGQLQLISQKRPKLFPFQIEVKRRIYEEIRNGEKRILLVAATGSGKTVMAGQVTADAISKGRKVLFLVHRDNLIHQTIDKFSKFNIDCGVIISSYKPNKTANCQISSVQTLARRDKLWFEPDIIILDEAHITAWSTPVKKLLNNHHRNDELIFLGLTATPWRLSKRESMGDLFDSLVCAPLPYQLMESGHLVGKVRYFGLPKPDLKGVRIQSGDFVAGDLELACNTPESLQNAVDNWKKLAPGRTTIAFAVGVAHAKAIAQAFNSAGIPAASVDGSTPIPERQRIYAQLARGDIKVLSSCEALAEGFDVPNVEAILLARPTKSKAKYFQQVGRGLRSSPGKIDCVVLDQAGNVGRFGFIEDLRRIELTESADSEKGEAPVKSCPECSCLVHISLMFCPECRYAFPPKEKEAIKGDLVELKGRRKNLKPQPVIVNAKEVKKTDELAMARYRLELRENYLSFSSPLAADTSYFEKHNCWPPHAWRRSAIFGDKPREQDFTLYHKYLKSYARQTKRGSDWVDRMLYLEFGRVFWSS